jgi:hypothetical protein
VGEHDSVPDPDTIRRMVRKSTIAIVLLWTLCLADAAWGGLTVRADEFTRGTSLGFGIAVVVMPLFFFPIASARAKRSPFFAPGLASRIDARAGEGATAQFLRRWRPLLMIALAGAVYGLVLGVRLARAGTATQEWWAAGFFLSAAAAFALSHLILRRRGVPGM